MKESDPVVELIERNASVMAASIQMLIALQAVDLWSDFSKRMPDILVLQVKEAIKEAVR